MSSVCLSVRPSVTLVDHDHIGWKSWKLIARTISVTPSLFVAQGHPPTPRGTWGNLGKSMGGVGKKWRSGAQKRQYLGNIGAYRPVSWHKNPSNAELHRLQASGHKTALQTAITPCDHMPTRSGVLWSRPRQVAYVITSFLMASRLRHHYVVMW